MELGKDILYLSQADIGALEISAAAANRAVEGMFGAKPDAGVVNLPKLSFDPGDGRLVQAMIAAADDPPFAVVKTVGVGPDNAARGLPHVSALLVLVDAATGVPVAVMDGTWITAVRTAAMTAVAARRLADPRSASIGFVACGRQARSHLAALGELFPITRVRAFSRRLESAEAFAREARAQGLEAVAVVDARDAVAGLDIVVTSVPDSPGLEPFLEAEWLAAGAFASLVDLGRSWRPEGLRGIERVVVDDRRYGADGVRRLAYQGPFHADLYELAAGAQAGPRAPGERSMLIFQGAAVADLAVAALVFEAARSRGLGTVLPL